MKGKAKPKGGKKMPANMLKMIKMMGKKMPAKK